MNNFLVWIKYSFVVAGSFLTSLLGGWDTALKVLVIFVILDQIAGMTAAYLCKNLDSRVGFKGIFRKILLFVPIAMGYLLDTLLGEELLRNLAIYFYIANEGLSLVENLGLAGVPIPSQIQDALNQLKGDKMENVK